MWGGVGWGGVVKEFVCYNGVGTGINLHLGLCGVRGWVCGVGFGGGCGMGILVRGKKGMVEG